MRTVHLVVPAGIEDPARPSGGNAYDLRVCRELTERGRRVVRHDIPGDWPVPGPGGLTALRSVLAGLAAGSVVLVDGLVGSAAGELLAAEAGRLGIVLLVHLPLGVGVAPDAALVASELRAVSSAQRVIVTSDWTRGWLLQHTAADPAQVIVARPGVDPAPTAVGGTDGGRLLSVGALAPVKGQDRVLAALNGIRDLEWTWTCVGSRAVDPAYVERLITEVDRNGLGGRVRLAGPQPPEELGESYAATDLLVVGSRHETYGMVVGEALARGIPVVVTPVGGVAEALGTTRTGVPGLVAATDDAAGLADAIRRWLTDPELRTRLRAAARVRRATLAPWSSTVDRVESALAVGSTDLGGV